MPLNDLIFPKTKATVGVMQFDCSVDENHVDEAEITDHPVEIGSNVSDHIRKMPATLELNGIVTNTPVTILASLLGGSPLTTDFLPTIERVEVAYAELRRLQEDGELVTVVTSLREYENMAVKSVAAKRNAANGNILDVIVNLQEVILASALAIDLPVPANVANKAAANKGKQSKTPASTEQTSGSQSALSSLTGVGA